MNYSTFVSAMEVSADTIDEALWAEGEFSDIMQQTAKAWKLFDIEREYNTVNSRCGTWRKKDTVMGKLISEIDDRMKMIVNYLRQCSKVDKNNNSQALSAISKAYQEKCDMMKNIVLNCAYLQARLPYVTRRLSVRNSQIKKKALESSSVSDLSSVKAYLSVTTSWEEATDQILLGECSTNKLSVEDLLYCSDHSICCQRMCI